MPLLGQQLVQTGPGWVLTAGEARVPLPVLAPQRACTSITPGPRSLSAASSQGPGSSYRQVCLLVSLHVACVPESEFTEGPPQICVRNMWNYLDAWGNTE